MLRICLLFVSVLLLTGCKGLLEPDPSLAPPFAGLGSDGEYHSMLDITRTKDLIIVFIHPDCPVGIDALSGLEKVHGVLGGSKVAVLGIVGVPVSQFEQWTAKAAPPIPCIADADRRFAAAYKADQSPTIQVIRRGGVLGSKWQELTPGVMTDVAKSVRPDFSGEVMFQRRSTGSKGRSMTQ